jgi:hypothetical protein
MIVTSLSAQRRDDTPCGFGSSSSCHNSFSWSDFLPFSGRQFDDNIITQYKFEYIEGSILHTDSRVSPLIENHTSGFEFAVEYPKYGGEPWYFYHNFPTVGWAFMYLDLGNSAMLGQSYTIYPYIDMPLLHTQMFSFNIKLGAGAAYINKKYNPNGPTAYAENNYAISSNLNGFLDLGANADLKLSNSQSSFISRFSLTGDIGLNHFSNGSVMKPNTGLNMINAAVGIKYSPYLTVVPMRMGATELKKQWSFEPIIGAGVNKQDVTDTREYLNASLNLGVYRPLTNIYRIGLGLDEFYNDAFFAARVKPDYYAGDDSKFRTGISLANELMFGDFIAGFHAGAYLYNQIPHDGWNYFRLVAKYRIYDDFFISASLKSHGTVAEDMELGIGYSFTKKEKAPYSWIPAKEKTESNKKSFFSRWWFKKKTE